MKKIEIEKFYLIHDGSKTGHPGLLIWKDDEANLYLLIRFGSTESDENILLKHPISSNIDKSFVYKRPFVGKRKDVGTEMRFNITIHDDDMWILIEIPKNNPKFSKTMKSKDKHKFNWRYKKTVK